MGLNSYQLFNEGMDNGQKKIVFSLFSKGKYSNEMISDLTALPLSDILRYRNEYNTAAAQAAQP